MEQLMREFLAANPDPGLSPGRYAVGVMLMLPFILLGIMWVAKTIVPVFPATGKWIADKSVLLTVLLGIAIFLFIT